MLRTKLLQTLMIAAGILASAAGRADDPPATTTDTSTESQALKDLQAEAALAKTKLELATSEMDLLKLKFTTIDTTSLPKGNATVTDMDLEGQLRAYAAAARSAEVIARDVKAALKNTPKQVVLASDTQLQALNQYRSFLAQMALMEKATNNALNVETPAVEDPAECTKKATPKNMAPMVALGTVTLAINSVLSIAALFKTDVDMKGKAVTLNDFAMTTLLLKALQAQDVNVTYPAGYYLLPPASTTGASVAAFDRVYALKPKLQTAAKTQSDKFDAIQKKHPDADAACKAALASVKQGVDKYVAGLGAAEKSIDEVAAGLTKQDAQSGLTLISTYLVSEKIQAAIQEVPVLQVKAIAAGGSTQTRKNWFSTKISFGGGSILSYQLFEQDGTYLAADTVPWYAGFLDSGKFTPGQVVLAGAPVAKPILDCKQAIEVAAKAECAVEAAKAAGQSTSH